MANDRLSVTPQLEAYNATLDRLGAHAKQRFFTHDLKNLLYEGPLMMSKALGIDDDELVEIIEQDEDTVFIDPVLRAKLPDVISKISLAAANIDVKALDLGDDVFTVDDLDLAVRQMLLLPELVPVIMRSFDYFTTRDPAKLAELRAEKIDVRTLCDFFDAEYVVSDEYRGDFSIDGARCMSVFNLLRNAQQAQAGYENTIDFEAPKIQLHINDSLYRIQNMSRRAVPEEVQRAMRDARITGMHFGLFIAAYYAAVVGDEIELEQTKIDPTDESRGWSVSFDLVR